jgi:hypothetical protein
VKWFQHDSDASHDPKLRAFLKRFHNRGYGTLNRIWEYIADHGHETGKGVDESGAPLPFVELAESCDEPEDYVRRLLDFCAERHHLDPELWAHGVVCFPAMANRADEYTRKKARKAARSQPTPDSVRTPPDSVPLQDKTRITIDHNRSQDSKPVELELTSPNGTQPQQLFQLWNQCTTKPIPQVRTLDDKRDRLARTALKAVWDLGTWRELFTWLNVQPWGRKNVKGKHRTWTFTFAWVLTDGKYRELIEQMRTGGPGKDPESEGRASGDRDDYSGI